MNIFKKMLNWSDNKYNLSIANNYKEYNLFRKKTKNYPICNAPFSSMYFRNDGKISVCCHNSLHLIGNYPTNSLLEAWNSTSINVLRKQMTQYYLEFGCYSCKSNIQSGNFQSTGANSFEHLKSGKWPERLEFELDYFCNLDCIMCSTKHMVSKNSMHPFKDASVFSKFLDELTLFIPHLKEAHFYGGEPFIIDNYFKIWELIRKLNPKIKIYLQTNGTILNDKIKALLENGNFNIGVSIDSLNEDNFSKIRQNGNLKFVLKNLNYFNDYSKSKKRPFSVSVCPIPNNINEIPEILNYFNKMGIPIFFHTVLIPLKHTLWTLSSDKLESIINYLKKINFKATNIIQLKNIEIFENLKNQLIYWHKQAIQREKDLTDLKSKSVKELYNFLIEKLSLFNYDNIKYEEKVNVLLKYFKTDEEKNNFLLTLNLIPNDFLIIVLTTEPQIIISNILNFSFKNEF